MYIHIALSLQTSVGLHPYISLLQYNDFHITSCFVNNSELKQLPCRKVI